MYSFQFIGFVCKINFEAWSYPTLLLLYPPIFFGLQLYLLERELSRVLINQDSSLLCLMTKDNWVLVKWVIKKDLTCKVNHF